MEITTGGQRIHNYGQQVEKLKARGMEPEDFVKKVLKERLNCSGAVCGNDFTFGKGAQGKAVDLKRLGEKYDIDVEIVSPLLMGGEVISSTEIRRWVIILDSALKLNTAFNVAERGISPR